MFASNALPPLTTFAHEHRPLRLNSDSSRPQPTGECRYLLLHPSAQNQRCSCQFFHHNRSAPGNSCECGHHACYHVHESNNEKQSSTETLHAALEKLNDKVKRLEETIQNERGNREAALQRERQMWERDIRVLREALAPFYQSEKEMRRKILDVEDRLESNYDEQVRLREHVGALDDATMNVEKRVEELEGLRLKRRRVGRNQVQEEPLQNGHVSPDNLKPDGVRPASTVDERSIHTPSSRALSPNGIAPSAAEPEEARSSGILNLVEMPRPATFTVPQRLSPPQEEPRSSGFLTLALGNQQNPKIPSDHAQQVALHQAARVTPPQDRPSPPSYAPSYADVPRASQTPPEMSSSKIPVIDVMVAPVNTSPRKRKHPLDRLALDVLADVSMASPLIR